jgi:hypothetical protein
LYKSLSISSTSRAASVQVFLCRRWDCLLCGANHDSSEVQFSSPGRKVFILGRILRFLAGPSNCLDRRDFMQDATTPTQSSDNPLIFRIGCVLQRVHSFKERAREFYFAVVLSCHECPTCGSARLRMTGYGRCSCVDGHLFDPTEAFQMSECCQAPLVQRMLHYECSTCRGVVPSRFLFDERLFDAEYFREMMQNSRERARQKREAIRLLLIGARSRTLELAELPGLDEVPGLAEALDSFICSVPTASVYEFAGDDVFEMDRYWQSILKCIDGVTVWFDALPALSADIRTDRVRRFVTLVYMDHEGVVDLDQRGERIVVRKHEADIEG